MPAISLCGMPKLILPCSVTPLSGPSADVDPMCGVSRPDRVC